MHERVMCIQHLRCGAPRYACDTAQCSDLCVVMYVCYTLQVSLYCIYTHVS
jgi:hypothetical protein